MKFRVRHRAQTMEHELEVTKLNLCGTRFGRALIIFAVAAAAPIPRVSAFHSPAFRPWSKARAAFRAFLPCDPPAGALRGEPRGQVMSVILASAKDDRQPWELLRTDLGQEFDGRRPIIEPCTGDQDDEQQPNRIDQHVPFAAFDFLASVIAAFGPTDFGRFDRLTVDTGRTGSGLTPLLLPHAGPQLGHALGPRALIPPLREVVVHRTFGEQLVWSHLPLTPSPILIPQRVEHGTHIYTARRTAVLGAWRRKPRLQNHPLFVS